MGTANEASWGRFSIFPGILIKNLGWHPCQHTHTNLIKTCIIHGQNVLQAGNHQNPGIHPRAVWNCPPAPCISYNLNSFTLDVTSESKVSIFLWYFHIHISCAVLGLGFFCKFKAATVPQWWLDPGTREGRIVPQEILEHQHVPR